MKRLSRYDRFAAKRHKELLADVSLIERRIQDRISYATLRRSEKEGMTPSDFSVRIDKSHIDGIDRWSVSLYSYIGVIILTGLAITLATAFIDDRGGLSLPTATLMAHALRLILSLAVGVGISILVVVHTYSWCNECGMYTGSWHSIFCSTCGDRFGLAAAKEVGEDEIKKSNDRWLKNIEERRESARLTLKCQVCGSSLDWDDGYDDFACPQHGSHSIQLDYIELNHKLSYLQSLQNRE